MNFKKTYLLAILLAFGVFAFGQVTITVQNVVQNCNNSSITFFVAVPGGQTYSGYVQSPGGLLPFTGTGSGTQQVSGLGNGYYMAVVDVLNGNPVNFESIEVYIYGKPQPAFTGTDADHECDNGIATASVFNGGLAPFTYLWSNGDTTQTVADLAPGTYYATVTDANGCTAVCFGVIAESCPEGAEIYPYVYILNCASDPIYADVDVHAAKPASSCATDFVGTLVMGGSYSEYFTFTAVGEYEAWLHHPDVLTSCFQHENTSSGGNPIFVEKATVDVIDANCADGYGTAVVTMTNLHGGTYSYNWNNGSTDDILIAPPGTYSVTITVSTYWGDNSAICYVTIGGSSSAINLSTSVTNNGCNGNNSGAINLTVSGGTPGYTYLWSNGATTEDISNLPGGTYTVTVTDAVGCVAVASAIVSSGSDITVTTTGTDASCFGSCDGTASATASGGWPAYSFVWSNGATTQSITGLCAGTYTVTVTDDIGCTGVGTVTIGQPPAVVASISATQPSCNGGMGSAIASGSGGTPPYTYVWSNGSNSQTINNLNPGTYTVTVSDTNNCTDTEFVTILNGGSISVTLSPINPTCFGGNNGQINVNSSGGTSPYSYLWSNGATTQMIFNLPVGTYSVTVTDIIGCSGTASVTLSSPPAISFSTSVTNNGCNGNNSGAINLTVSGGTPGYTYLWSNGATTEDISNLPGGTYTVTVTDAVGCVAVASAIVSSGSDITVTTTGTDASCFGSCDGTASATASGGWPAYSFVWSNGATTQSITGLCAGTYTVTVTDDIGCTGVGTFIVGNSGSSIIVTITSTNIPCPGGLGGSATANHTGGTGPYTYFWTRPTGFTSTTQTIDANGNSGLYSVTVTDANGCTGTGSVVITEPSPISTTVQTTDSGCGSVCTGTLFAGNPVGGTSPYSYFWSNGTTTYTGQSVNNVCPGTWTLTITDANGCTKTVGAVVGVDADITPPTIVSCPADITISCLDYDLFIPPTDMPTATDDCSAVTVSVTEDDFLSCGNGYYYRLFTVSDLAGNTATCEQLIVIEPEPVTEPDIIFPDQHQYVEVCSDICGNIAIPFAPPAVDPYLEYCGEVNFVIAQQNTLNALPGDSCTIVRKWLAYDCLSNLITPNLFLQTVHVTFDPDCSNFSSPITVYPNPFMDEVNMLIDFTGNLEILIAFAGSGQTVYYFNGFVSSTQQIVINFTTQNFPPGLYYVAVTTPDGVFTELMTYQP